MKATEFARKREATVKKKVAVEVKKVVKAAGKKNYKKDKKADYLATIDKTEKAIVLLF